jgi:hypothetical protein
METSFKALLPGLVIKNPFKKKELQEDRQSQPKIRARKRMNEKMW